MDNTEFSYFPIVLNTVEEIIDVIGRFSDPPIQGPMRSISTQTAVEAIADVRGEDWTTSLAPAIVPLTGLAATTVEYFYSKNKNREED